MDSQLSPSSSKPVDLPEEQQALFRDVLQHLEQNQFPYAVAGAFALRHHTGISRFTKDLDVFLTSKTASVVLTCLRDKGFECEVCDPVWLAKVRKGEYFVDLITGMSNAVIRVDDSWTARAIPARVCNVDSRVLAAEELLVSKLFVSRRERFDGADVAHIIFRSQGKLQWNRILELAGGHWELVLWSLLLFAYAYPAHREFVPQIVWKTLLSRFSDQVEAPTVGARFRGSLIDDVMFAIDVDEWGLRNLLTEARNRAETIHLPPAFRTVGS